MTSTDVESARELVLALHRGGRWAESTMDEAVDALIAAVRAEAGAENARLRASNRRGDER